MIEISYSGNKDTTDIKVLNRVKNNNRNFIPLLEERLDKIERDRVDLISINIMRVAIK